MIQQPKSWNASRRKTVLSFPAGPLFKPGLSSRNVKLVLVPKKQHEQRPEYRNDNARGMKLGAGTGTGEQMHDQPSDNRTDDTEPDRPQKRHVHVQDRLRSPP